MLIKTRNFGELNIDEKHIIKANKGLIGLEKSKRFILLDHEDEKVPFKWLQSIDEPEISFPVLSPETYLANYKPPIKKEDLEEIGLEKIEDAVLMTIIVIPKEITKMRTNLSAPIIVNPETKEGKQVLIDDEKYPAKYYIIEEMKKAFPVDKESNKKKVI